MPLIYALVAGLTLVVYLWTAGPTFYWLDSSEFVAAAATLGIAHPPGHPLAALVAQLFLWLPIGNLAFRVTLASAACASLAAATGSAIAHELVRRADPTARPALAKLCAAVAGLGVGLSYAVWAQATRAEVYALNLALLGLAALCVLCWDRTADRRHLLASALLLGLALCNHHFLVLLALPAFALFVLPRRPRPRLSRCIAAFVALTLLGLTTLSYLPLRAARLPLVNWGAPTTVSRLVWVVSAQAFQKAVDHAERVPLATRGQNGLAGVFRGFGYDSTVGIAMGALFGIAGVAGLYLCVRLRASRRAGLLLSLLLACNLLTPVLIGMDLANPDAYGYLAVSILSLAPAAALLLYLLAEALQRHLGRAAALIFCAAGLALPAGQLRVNYHHCDLSQHFAAEDLSWQTINNPPPGAVLFTSYFETIFNLWALQGSSDARPDLTVIHRNWLTQPGYAAAMAARYPALGPALLRAEQAQTLLATDLGAISTDRPVHLEYDVNLGPEVQRHLLPAGLTQTFASARATPVTLLRAAAVHIAAIRRLDAVLSPDDARADSETRRALAYAHYMLARFCCEQGLAPLAASHLSAARELAPADRSLRDLAARCVAPAQP